MAENLSGPHRAESRPMPPSAPSVKPPSTKYLDRMRSPRRGSSSSESPKYSAKVRPKPPADWERQKAAQRIQAKYRGRRLSVIEKAKDVRAEISLQIDKRVESAKYAYVERLLSENLRSQCNDDPWLSKDANEQMIKCLEVVLNEVHRRSLHEMEETSGKQSFVLKKVISELVKPESWPPPPPLSQPLTWFRAKLLYAIMPADKNSTYRSSIAPWMFGVELAFYVPCLGTPLWLTYTLIILFTETDLFQLYTCIMNFKSYAFFFWGLIPIFTDWFDFYWSFTSGETLKQFLRSHQNDTADNWKDFFRRPELEFNELEIDELRSGLMVYGGPSTNMLDRMQDRAFLLNCALCWVVFARYKWLRSQYFLGRREPPTYTGDNDCGDREQTLFVAWDVGAITSIILIFSLDLTYRIRELSGVSAYFVSIYETFTMQARQRRHRHSSLAACGP